MSSLRSSILILIDAFSHPDCRATAGTQQSHCGGVTQHMHADGFLTQGRTDADRDLGVFGKPVFDGVAAE
jgi:hypothetical protein